MSSYVDPSNPIPGPTAHIVTELYGYELREHAGLAAGYNVPAEVAKRYKAACYEAAAILLDAAADLKKHLPLEGPAVASSGLTRAVRDFVVPALLAVGLATTLAAMLAAFRTMFGGVS